MKYKNTLLKYSITLLIILLIVLTLVFIWNKTSKIEHFEYPITKDSQKWGMMSSQARVDALIIPEKIVKRMSDKALIQAIAEYPLLIDLYAYGRTEDSLEVFSRQCSAYKELITRNSAKNSFLTDGISIMNELSKDDEKNAVAIMALYDIIRTLYSDIDINQYFDGTSHGLLSE